MTSTSNSEWTHFCGLWLPRGAFIAPPDDITTSGRNKINRKSAQQKKIGRTQRSTSRRNVHLIDVQSAIHPTAGSVHEPETRGAQRRIRPHCNRSPIKNDNVHNRPTRIQVSRLPRRGPHTVCSAGAITGTIFTIIAPKANAQIGPAVSFGRPNNIFKQIIKNRWAERPHTMMTNCVLSRLLPSLPRLIELQQEEKTPDLPAESENVLRISNDTPCLQPAIPDSS